MSGTLWQQVASNPVGTEQVAPQQSLTAVNSPFDPLVGFGSSGQPITQSQLMAAHQAIQQAMRTAPTMALGMMGTIAGPAAKTADLAKLAAAKDMAAQGVSRDAIWGNTGWYQGPEGNWRFEIPDNQMQRLAVVNSDGAPLGAVIDHPALFDAYPQLRDTIVRQGANRSGGQFQPGGEVGAPTITLGSNQSPRPIC